MRFFFFFLLCCHNAFAQQPNIIYIMSDDHDNDAISAYNKQFIKSSTLILGESKALNSARYIHGEMGKGTWTFYGGHDPEDYQHAIGDPPTDLSLHPMDDHEHSRQLRFSARTAVGQQLLETLRS